MVLCKELKNSVNLQLVLVKVFLWPIIRLDITVENVMLL